MKNTPTLLRNIFIVEYKIIYPWLREEGHYLQLKDLNEIFKKEFDILIIGTGVNGIMKIDNELIDYLNKNNIDNFEKPLNFQVFSKDIRKK